MTRLKTSTKGKRWGKGHSSSSNPSTHKFRDRAKSRRMGPSSKSSALTTEALARHEDRLESDVSMTVEDDKSTTAGSRRTGLNGSVKSGWTVGSEISGAFDGTAFQHLQKLWNSSLESHRQICAVLAAVTEVIKSQGGSQTDMEYFAALMTALESADAEDMATALAFLLNLVVGRISSAILKSKFSLCSKVLSEKLRVYSSTHSSSLLKSLIGCLTTVLAAQEKAVWSESSTRQMLHSLLSHTVSTKPKVRKMAHQSVCGLVKSAPKSVANEVADFCIHELEKHGGPGDSTKTLHILALLRDIIPFFSRQNMKTSCECLLRLMTLSNAIVTGLVMQVFISLFSSEPVDLSSQLNAQLINALFDCQPNVKDMQTLQAWLVVMQNAYINLQRLDYQLCYSHLPRLFSTCLACLLSPYDTIIQVASETMKVMLTKCVSPHVESVVSAAGGSLKGKNSVLEKVFKLIESGLKYRYHAAWCQVLGTIQVAFEVMGRSCCDVIVPQSLVSLCNLHEMPNFPFIPQLEAAVGAAVKTVGPRVVLGAIPLELENEDVQVVFPRAWLIPVLKKHTCNTELQFFTVTLLPLAAHLRNRASTLSESGRNLEAKVYDTLQSQIWGLLPSFCKNPVDLKQSFKNIARILGTALNERPELRKTVCHALCLLIDSSKDNDGYRTELSQFSKNFLPILFNLHTSEPASANRSILGCIAAYLSISNQQLVNSLFGKVGMKLASADVDKPTRQAVMDLALVMVPYVSQKSLAMLYKAVVTSLESDDNALQKKTYKILERICSCESEHHQAFIESHLDALQSSLLTSLSSAAASSKKPRLKCLSHIVHRLKGDQTNFIYSVTPEVILCTKEVNEGTRAEAYSLLVDLANAHDRCCDGSRQDNITHYFHVVLAGLAATSPHMLSATILSIGRLVYEFKDILSHDMIQKLLNGMNVFLVSRSREVVKATLGFIKVIVSVLDSSHLLSHVNELISSIVSWTKDTNYHFRHECRVLFERLIRKLGYEVIFGMVPESHRKLLVHVRKATERAKRRKAKSRESQTVKKGLSTQRYEELLCSSDEDEPSTSKKSGKRMTGGAKESKRKNSQAWIQEGPDDEPIDLLDQSAARRVLASDPSDIRQTRDHAEEFEINSAGKLVIKEEDEKDESVITSSNSVKSVSGRKRKRTSSVDDEEQSDMEETGAKRPNTGIHRLISNEQVKFPDYGAEYRAKKAKGDVKVKGKSDPYAYVPLDFRKLNKRKKAKLAGQFRGIMSAASKGVQRGHRSRTKSLSRHKHMRKSKK